MKPILDILYIVLKFEKLEIQRFKQCENQSWNEEVMTIWRQLRKVEEPFRNSTYGFEIQLMDLKSNLWIQNPIRNEPNFKFTHYHFDVSPPLPQELHLGHSIRPKWTPCNYKSPFYYFLIILGNYFVISGQWECTTC